MAWVKIDDHFDEHPKLAQVGPIGWGIWLAGLAYCNRNLTDGFIPWSKARMLASMEVVDGDGNVWRLARTSAMSGEDIDADWVTRLLVESGLWEEVCDGHRVTGYRIHDYADYQPSREQVLSERESARERMRQVRENKKKRSPEVRPNKSRSSRNPVPVPVPVRSQKIENEESETNVSAADKPPAPTNHPYALFQAFCEERGIDESEIPKKAKDKQLGIAKRLTEYAEGDVRACIRFIASQTWRTSPWDLGTVESQIGTWIINGKPDVERPNKEQVSHARHQEPNQRGEWDAFGGWGKDADRGNVVERRTAAS